jgi:biotin-dependent carboxylase-like uncharacterized protein
VKLLIEKPGMFTTVQDLGRHGRQTQGVPVAGAMDAAALRVGNILVGNDGSPSARELAGLEITVAGPAIRVLEGEGCFVVTGAEVGVTKNGVSLPCWTVHRLAAGDAVAFFPPNFSPNFSPQFSPQGGSRAYFCVSGGIDVPLVMGSRSTYTRGKFGGHQGRSLRTGDVLAAGAPHVLWAECEGLECPPRLRPSRDPSAPLRAIPGPQDDLFTEEGLATFYSSEYVIANSADRMGYRLEGPAIAHRNGADIVSDAVSLGSVQVPGDGRPIVMLADRQTTGGYTKIATVCAVDVGNLAQRLPGQGVRFEKITVAEAVALLRHEEELFGQVRRLRAAWRSRPEVYAVCGAAVPQAGIFSVCVDGEPHRVEWERLE